VLSQNSSQKSLVSTSAYTLAEAVYVVVATTAYIRLYSAESLLVISPPAPSPTRASPHLHHLDDQLLHYKMRLQKAGPV